MNLTNRPVYQKGQKRRSAKDNDRAFLEWISYQPSCIDEAWHQLDDGKGHPRNIACHVRRLNRGAGLGKKPPFSAVPMTQMQHDLQGSSGGEAAVLRLYLKMNCTEEEAKRWFENKANEYVRKWRASTKG